MSRFGDRCFFIKSDMNGMVLDCRGNSTDPGTDVITYPMKDDDNENQLWFQDRINHCIRSRNAPDLCLTLDEGDNTLKIDEFRDDECQRWYFSGDHVHMHDNSDRCLDIARNDMDAGARVCAWEYHGKDNQKWSVVYDEQRYFHIKSEMHGKYLDVRRGCTDPGTDVIMWDFNGNDNQQWYEDERGVIHSKLNDFVLDCSDGDIQLQPHDEGSGDQNWTMWKDKIVNISDSSKALDIRRGDEDNGATLCSWEWHGGDNQRWSIEFVD